MWGLVLTADCNQKQKVLRELGRKYAFLQLSGALANCVVPFLIRNVCLTFVLEWVTRLFGNALHSVAGRPRLTVSGHFSVTSWFGDHNLILCVFAPLRPYLALLCLVLYLLAYLLCLHTHREYFCCRITPRLDRVRFFSGGPWGWHA